jgi:hypothetical protein
MHIHVNERCRIDAPRSAYHDTLGVIRKALLDHKGRPASAQVEINGERVWFAASAVQPIGQEQAA